MAAVLPRPLPAAHFTSTGTLTNPKRLYDFLDASTKAVVTDQTGAAKIAASQ